LLREVEERRRVIGRFGECFRDHRDERKIEHTTQELVRNVYMGSRLDMKI
jgi:hypothetical protein